MRYIHTLSILLITLFIGCSDLEQNEEVDTSELLRLLDEDEAVGVEGFDDGGLMDLDYDIGLEVFGLGRTTGDTLSYGE